MVESGETSFTCGCVTTQETGCARAWFKVSTPGKSTGYDWGVETREGCSESSVEGNARELRYVAAAKYRSQVYSLARAELALDMSARHRPHSFCHAFRLSMVAPYKFVPRKYSSSSDVKCKDVRS